MTTLDREIRFKALTPDRQWVCCDLFHCLSDNSSINIHYCTSGGYYFTGVEPLTVCQFTGLYDSNHKEIYEGDILRHNDDGWSYPVIFIGGSFQLDSDDNSILGVPLYQFAPEVYMSVVGNIFDHDIKSND